jgi:hypothetical protein
VLSSRKFLVNENKEVLIRVFRLYLRAVPRELPMVWAEAQASPLGIAGAYTTSPRSPKDGLLAVNS